MFADNLVELRKYHALSQEELAEKIGVSRQTLSKYETGESLPDIEKCKALADVFGITVDDLICYEKSTGMGLMVPPKGKYVFGMVKVREKGQIELPAKASNIKQTQSTDPFLYSRLHSVIKSIQHQDFLDRKNRRVNRKDFPLRYKSVRLYPSMPEC